MTKKEKNMMSELSASVFIDKYKPICNNRFPTFNTILPLNHPLQPYVWDKREKFLISEYIPNRCFFSVVLSPDKEGYYKVIPSSIPSLGIAWIITECAWRPESKEYVEFNLE